MPEVICKGTQAAAFVLFDAVHGPAGVTVPAGWHCSRHLRLTGRQKGTAYTRYHNPENTVFRSKASARKQLGRSNRKAVNSGRSSADLAEAKDPKQVSRPVFYSLGMVIIKAKHPRIACSHQSRLNKMRQLWRQVLQTTECWRT